jgi:hypothetical protein
MDLSDRIDAGFARVASEINAVRTEISGIGIVPPYLTYDEPLAMGSVITCISPWVTATYQWKRDGVNIAGATAATYALIAADSEAAITCVASGSGLLTSGVAAPVIEGEDLIIGWDTEALDAPGMIFSDSNRTVYANNTTGTDNWACYSLASKSTGKWYASVKIVAREYGDISITDDANENYVHYSQDGKIYSSTGGLLDEIDGYAAADDIDASTDTDGHYVWFRKNGGDWNGDGANDPETGVGGYALPATASAYHVKVQLRYFLEGERTLNVGDGAFPYPAPAGYLPFGTP